MRHIVDLANPGVMQSLVVEAAMEPTSAAGRGRVSITGVAEQPAQPFPELLRACNFSAVHLEMRDVYTPADPWFRAWLAGDQEEFERRLARPWLDLIREVGGRGVQVRRARIVSEPVTDYIKFEHATTGSNVAAGEDVRWLPRRQASRLLLPGNDFWVFDDRLVLWNHFTGEGEFSADGRELASHPETVKMCATAFNAVWERAIPHGEYQPA
jgi:hypothetical protein